MSKETENPFAFPLTDGMLLRDYFAAKALQGLYSPEIMYQSQERMKAEIEHAVKTAYTIAEAMLEERSKTDKLPSEIKQERDKLIRVLQDFISSAEVIDDEHFAMEIDQAKELINKIESNG